MMPKRILAVLLLAFVWTFAVQAGETTFRGQTINYTGTVAVTGDDSTYRLFRFTSGTGTIILPSDVTADILAVGGGGGGGGGRRSGSKSFTYTGGSGGGGGGVDEQKGVSLSVQTLSISVGAGGAGGSFSTSKNQAGSQGGESKVYNGSTNYARAGGGSGGAGGDASSDGQGAAGQTGTGKREGKASDVSGTLTTYGDGGQKANNSTTTGSARTTNTGNGGYGAAKPGANDSQHYAGQGGDSGVVIVKITDIAEPKPVASLITGKIRVGAYEVEILNASRTNWVDGELVITYLNADTAVGKSFTLPKQTRGQLLAVGGGGAGGQDTAGGFSSSCGLPGGGGAGGLVISNEQEFAAAKYRVTVGAGGAEVGRKLEGDTWKPTSGGAGADGGDSVVRQGATVIVTAKGGGGGGHRGAGRVGGSGGGGSNSGGSGDGTAGAGGSGMTGQGNGGGSGTHKKYGAGGGGAGGPGSDTTSIDRSKDPTTIDVNVSFAGGPGRFCDITGKNVEYARGGAGGVPRVYGYFYTNYVDGVCKTNYTSSTSKVPSGCRGYTCEAKDGKPGRDGYGDGGGGSGQEGYTGSNPTFAGRGGSGAVIVRIPPYPISAEDALKEAFEGQPVTVSGSQVTLTGDVAGPIGLPDNIGAVTIDLAGHAIAGADGAAGEPVDITPGGDGEPAIRLVPHVYTCEAGRTQVKIRGSGELVGGNGGKGYPGGRGSAAVARAASVDMDVTVDTGAASQTSGADGETYVQHSHVWTYKQVGNEIHATCVATDGEQCSYKKPEHALKIVLHADDVEFTGARYDSAGVDNGVLPVVGIPTGIVFYEGREDKGTVYPKSATPPTDAGYYLATLTFNGMTMEKDFSIIEGKMQQDTVYQSAKTAVRSGSDVLITLRASYDGAKAINYGNVLFLGSRCSAHSMKAAALAGTINALTPFANVQWYAYGSTDPTKNKSGFTVKGQQVKESEFTLVGANHYVYDKMMDDLYAELVENTNNRTYDMVILEFDGDLLGRNHLSPYQLIYTLPNGWTDGKAAVLRTAMSAFYDANRVVWIVPKVDADKDDSGYTGVYPWTSKPEFVWQRALLNATEDAGYCCPLQKNYEDANALVSYMQQALIGAYFKKVKITDKIADGLSFSQNDVAAEFRDVDGLWKNAWPSAVESRYGTTITAAKTVSEQTVTVEFDTSAFQAEALRCEALVNNDVRVTIRARIEDEFFEGIGVGAPTDTNVGDAMFVYSGGEDVGDFTNNVPPASIPNVNPNPICEAKDYVGYYDAEGHTITVTVIDPDPAVKTPDIRYSLEKGGSYDKDLLLTNVCEAVDVWFTLTAEGYATVTNYAKVTIRPRVVELTAEDATKAYDGAPLTTNGFKVASVTPEDYAQGKGFVPGEGIDKVTMTDGSRQTEVGSHPNIINPDGATMTPKTGTDLGNYIIITHPGTLEVTPALPMGIQAFDAEKFYDADPTNITWVVTNAQGGVISDAAISLREKGTTTWIPVADFTKYVDTTNVTVEVKAERSGFAPAFAEATVLVLPRPVTLTSGSRAWTYDGAPHAFTNLTVTGFVAGEGLAETSGWATVTDVAEGQVDNAFAYALVDNTLADNYTVTVVTGKLAVVAAPVVPKNPSTPAENPGDEPQPGDGVVLWAENVVKMYDGVGTNVIAGVCNAVEGNGFAIEYTTNSDLTGWVSELAFTNVVDAQKVYFRAVPEGTDPNYVGATGYAFVTITNRPATITFTAADKVYDATVAATCTATNFENLVSGEGFALDASSMSFAFDTPDVGSGKTVTAAGYADSLLAPLGETLASNYSFAFVPTTTAAITHALQEVASAPYSGVYDGAGHTIAVTQEGGAVTYLVDGSWVPDAPLYTNRVEATDVVFRVTRDNFETFEGTNTVTVTPRPVTVASGTKTDFPYDGLPHAYTNLTVEGFVAGEGLATTTGWATVTDVAEGQVDNAFAYALADNTLADNYTVTVVTGKLAVVAAPVVPKNPSTPAENPGDEPQPGDGVVLWAENVVKMYDGVGTNVIAGVCNAVGGDAFAIEYSVDEVVWAADLAFTNVVDAQKVYVRAIPQGDVPNYLPTTGFAYVTVTNRPATVTFTAADKVYDATVAATCTATNFENLVSGEGFALDASSMSFSFDTPDVGSGKTVTAVGYADSLVIPLVGTLASNYSFAFVPTTTAAITRGRQTVASAPYSGVYDGAGHTIAVTQEGGTVTYLVDGSWVPDAPLYTNRVEATDVVFRVTRDNFETFEGTNTVTVTPRPVTVASGTKTDFPYDGLPHAYTNLTATGFVAGEGLAETSGWATVTDVAEGQVDNAFAYALADNTLADNYEITVVEGKLAVEPAPVVPKAPSGPAENPGDEPGAGEGPTLWARNVVKMYDGLGTNVLAGVYNAVGGNAFTVEYSVDEVVWAADLAFTNVVDAQKVYVRAIPQGDVPNYLPTNGYAFVTITQRVVEVTSGTEEWTYDGQAHSNLTVTVTKGSFAPGEGISTNDFTTIKEVGTKDNAFTVMWNDGTDPANYSFSVMTGKLVVVAQAVPSYEIASIEWYHNRADGLYYPRIVVRYLAGDASRLVGVSFACDGEMHELPMSCVAELKTATVPGQEFVFGVDTNKFPVSYNRTNRDGYIIWNTAEEKDRAMLFGEYKTVRPLTLELEVQGTVRISDEDVPARFEEFRVGDQKISGKVSTEPGARVWLYGCSAIGGEWVLVCELQMDEEGRFEVGMPTGLSFFRLEGGRGR